MKDVIIFGDSYSTFEGYIPEGYATYYCPNGREQGPAVTKMDVESTWWKQFVELCGVNLLLNNSWSGSTIGYTGYDNADCSKSSSFIYRYKKLRSEGFFDKNTVDTVLVFGGTNDSWSNSPLGEMKYADWEEKDLFNVLPAICYFAYTLKTDLPTANIVFIINTDIKEEIQTAIENAASYFGAKSIRMHNIDKENGHPTAKGMGEICKQVAEGLQ
jgi:hypothetical protein